MTFSIIFFATVSLIIGILGLVLAFQNYNLIKSEPEGDQKMSEISSLIKSGADAYLKAQFMTVLPFIGVFSIGILLLFSINHDFQTSLYCLWACRKMIREFS
ncbi:MAG: sodium/proton-translocating pyrophosphatase [Deltaproteobacteria bacterium]|nr:sodium/proton-translocating pyrophosphatase [Deltaproteobacteria bacterium]